MVQMRGSGVFSLLQVSPAAAFLVFFTKDVLPDPLIICLIKSHLSFAQCAKLMELWVGEGGSQMPPWGCGEEGCLPTAHSLWTETYTTGATQGATQELPQNTQSGRRQSPIWGHPGLMEEIRSVAWERPHV